MSRTFRRVLDAYHDRGIIFRLIGDYDAAYGDFVKLRDLSIKAKYLEEGGRALYEIGYIMYLKARYAEALVYYEQAKKIFELNKDSRLLAEVYPLVAVVYRMQGKYRQAIGLIEKAIGFFSKGGKKEPGRLWNALGHTYWRSGNYRKAMRCYKKALQLSGKNKVTYTTIINNLGLLFTSMKRYERALDFHMRALMMRGEMNDKSGLASSYLNIGNIYLHMKKYEQAKDYWQKAMQISNELRTLDVVVMCQNNLAELLSLRGDYSAAIDLFKKTITAKKRLGMNSYMPSSYFGLATAYLGVYKKEGGIPVLRRSLDAAKKLKIIAGKLHDKYHLMAARRLITRINKLKK